MPETFCMKRTSLLIKNIWIRFVITRFEKLLWLSIRCKILSLRNRSQAGSVCLVLGWGAFFSLCFLLVVDYHGNLTKNGSFFYLEFSCSAQCDYLQWTNIPTRGVKTLYTCSHSHALEIKFMYNSNILPRLCSNINLLFVTVASYTWKCLVLHIVNLA